MIDFHSHILPGVDDGSKDLEMTQQMLEQMNQQGIQAVVATPHFYATSDRPDRFLQRRAKALQKVAALEEGYPQIIPGAEVAYFEGMSRSGVLEPMQLGESGMLLVEMPFCAWTKRMIHEVCEIRTQTGLTPVLAHVDRYRHRKQLPRFIDQLLEAGVLFQCNADIFLRPIRRKRVLKLLKEGKIHFLGSDAHNLTTRPPQMEEAMQVIAKKLGAETLEKLHASAANRLYGK